MEAIHLVVVVVVVLAAFPEAVATLVKGREPLLVCWAMLILLQL
jgi:cytochrome bd-type quinol oxidase subunit 2